MPAGCGAMERIAQSADAKARVWLGAGGTDLPPARQGIVVLGAFIHALLHAKVAEQRTLLASISFACGLAVGLTDLPALRVFIGD